MENITLDEMNAQNDAQQALCRMKAVLCEHALVTLEECKNYKRIDKKLETKHATAYPNEYMRFETQYSPKILIYSRDLRYNESVGVYLDSKDVHNWEKAIDKTTQYRADFIRYADELEAEKKTYPAHIEREAKIKELQNEAEETKLSGTGQKFFPRSFCSQCRYK